MGTIVENNNHVQCCFFYGKILTLIIQSTHVSKQPTAKICIVYNSSCSSQATVLK